jgi:hypothetical protein
MFKQSIPVIIALSFISFLTLSLPGCGGGGKGSILSAYYVDPAAGLDTNAGTQAAPFKTITKAINAAKAVATTQNVDIYAASGVYNTASGEVFPLMPTTGENLIGPTTTTGTIPVTANIDGAGNYTITGGGRSSHVISTTIAFAPGVMASVSGITANGSAPTVLVADNATVTLSNNIFKFTTTCCASYPVWIVNGSLATLTSNTITAFVAVESADASTKVIARNNNICGTYGVVTADPSFSLITASQLDLGTAASPGNNTILCSSVGVANWGQTGNASVTAVGNTWTPSVQGADASGHYASQLIAGPTTSGINYVVLPTAGIQF